MYRGAITKNSRLALQVMSCARQQMRFYAMQCTALRRNNNNNNKSNTSSSKDAAEEDRAELERERLLRERFAEKVQQSMPQGGAQSCAGGSCAGGSPAFGAAGVQRTRSSGENFFRFMFFFFAFISLASMSSMANRNSPAYTMQGLPWWELPVTSAAYFLLLRACYPRSEEARLKEEFESATRQDPRLTFDQFVAGRYPNMFDGYRTSQAEAVAAVAACLAAAKDLKFAQTMVRAVGWSKDPRANTDTIVDALRRDYAHLF